MLEAVSTGFVNLPLLETLEIGAGWIARQRSEYFDDPPNLYVFDSGPTASILYTNQRGYQPRDPSWGFSIGGSGLGLQRAVRRRPRAQRVLRVPETSTSFIDQDLIFWTRCTYEKLAGRRFLDDELLKIGRFVRGARTLDGLEEWSTSLEDPLPHLPDFLWKPLELIGLGEWLILKDLRGFAFGDFGWLATHVGSFRENYYAYSAASACASTCRSCSGRS
jgi:hypothetical protein